MGKTDIGHLRPVLSTPIYLYKITKILKIGNFRSIFICSCWKMNEIIFFQILHATFYIHITVNHLLPCPPYLLDILALFSLTLQIRILLFAILFTGIMGKLFQGTQFVYFSFTNSLHVSCWQSVKLFGLNLYYIPFGTFLFYHWNDLGIY